MTPAMSETNTNPEARDVIARMVTSVCSDGNSDPARLADEIIAALAAEGIKLVRDEAPKEARTCPE